MIMKLCDVFLFVVAIMVSIHPSQLLDFTFRNDEYNYLPHNQGVLRVNLSHHVTIDRKAYTDIWIYRNGFVTLGNALEEEAYPVITGSGRIRYQPFENLIGENIIAVFITLNKKTPNSAVRLREFYYKSLNDVNKEILRKFENIIVAAYGNTVSKPIESVVTIEWIDMQVEGGKDKKNSFRLHVLSNKDQSFALFDYWSVESISYQLFSDSFNYQSGIRSYGNRNYIIPLYQIPQTGVPIKRSSNIAIQNLWLMNLGDSSYSIDLGFPTEVSQDNKKPRNIAKALDLQIASLNKERYFHTPENSEDWTTNTQSTSSRSKETVHKYSSTDLVQAPKDGPDKLFNIWASTANSKEHIDLNTQSSSQSSKKTTNKYSSTDLVRTLKDGQDKLFNIWAYTANSKEHIDLNTQSSSQSSKKTTNKYSSTDLIQTPKDKPCNTGYQTANSNDCTDLNKQSSNPSLKETAKQYLSIDQVKPAKDRETKLFKAWSPTEYSIQPREVHTKFTTESLKYAAHKYVGTKQVQTLSDWTNAVSKEYQTEMTRPSPGKESDRFTYTHHYSRPIRNDKSIHVVVPKDIAKRSERDYIQTKHFIEENGEYKRILTNASYCDMDTCGFNQECFMFNGSSCCQCAVGTVHMISQCITAGSISKIRSSGSVSLPIEGSFLTLDLSLSHIVRNKILSVHLTLQSNRNIEPYIRNFILLLYPMFHIPMAFYASPWKRQKIPNLSSLVKNIAGLKIYIAIDGYGDLSVTFKLERTNEDQWTIFINSLDMKRVIALNLEDLKLDEKTTKQLYLNYVLTHRDSVDFIENSVSFNDDIKNRTVNVKWRGSMTFTSNCLSNFIESRNYFVKFADTGYCNTDCIGRDNTSCRMMCLSTPYVFDNIPGPCDGNHCPNNMVCVQDKDRYDCKCPMGFVEQRDHCVANGKTPSQQKQTNIKNFSAMCSECSTFSNCRIMNYDMCCICKTGYVGTGRTCFPRDGQFEIEGFGKFRFFNKKRESGSEMAFRLLFRQWSSSTSINHATYVDTGKLPYLTSKQKNFVHLILMLTPIFDIPMSLFAKDKTSNLINSIYAVSKGSLTLTVDVKGISTSPISIIFNVLEKNDSLEINVKVLRSSAIIDDPLIKQAQQIFENRVIPDIKYRLWRRQLILMPYEIKLDDNVTSTVLRINGSGKLDGCHGNEEDETMFVIRTQQPIYCKTKCTEKYCEPYCQAIPILNVASKVIECNPPCHEKALCSDNVCICQPGYSGDGLFCSPITKTLECKTELDCNHRPFFECRNSTCSCKQGMVLKDNKCVNIDPCQSCGAYEQCENGHCVCSPQFLRNRVSQMCTFDCSVCDIYSTTCTLEMCSCKDKFVYEIGSNTTCTLKCQSDSDCPSNEICGALNICICPSRRVGGLCESISDCNSCHRSAVCHNDKCNCIPEWIGDGISCKYNCSLCFQPLYCDPMSGCSCPPELIGDGKTCTENKCLRCPANSKCERTDSGNSCQCNPGMIMTDSQCSKDIVQVDILPTGSLSIRDGEEMELICLAISKANNFELSWSRKSGKKIFGNQLFLDETKKILKLTTSQIRGEDDDEYICRASSGEYNSISVFVGRNICLNPCHKYATCVSGKCQCSSPYIGDGFTCIIASKCPSTCQENMICNETLGQCICERGFREKKSLCLPDCTIRNYCQSNAICNTVSGVCECIEGFMGNGKHCWKQRINCLLTKKCAINSSCNWVEEIRQHICVCDDGFIGDGLFCNRKVECDQHPCSSNSFCEPTIINDHLGNLHKNGKCSCEPGYRMIKGTCQDPRLTNITFWMTMGEAIISLGINESKSRIRFIDTFVGDNSRNGEIVALTGDCFRNKLYWSGENGVTIKSMSIDSIPRANLLLSGLGKVTGLSVDSLTGNVFFTDSYNGKIAVIDPERNISQTIIKVQDYHPGQIVTHSAYGRLFWTVSDFSNHRIETSLMTGEQRRVFMLLTNRPISLTIVLKNNTNDLLCWMEVNDHIKATNSITSQPTNGFIKCANISDNHSPTTATVHYNVQSDEPSSAFAYSHRFYWGVRKGKYIRTSDISMPKIKIRPNCCDVGVRGLLVMGENCPGERNPCTNAIRGMCRHICVPKKLNGGRISASCINDDYL